MLIIWTVEKCHENGGYVRGVLTTQFKCPLGHTNPLTDEEIEYSATPDEGQEAVIEKLAEHRVCPECGVVMSLSLSDRERIKLRMEDRAPHEA